MKITVFRKHGRLYPFAGFAHKHRNGSLVLVGEASWRTVNGIFLNSRRLNRMVWIEWR